MSGLLRGKTAPGPEPREAPGVDILQSKRSFRHVALERNRCFEILARFPAREIGPYRPSAVKMSRLPRQFGTQVGMKKRSRSDRDQDKIA